MPRQVPDSLATDIYRSSLDTLSVSSLLSADSSEKHNTPCSRASLCSVKSFGEPVFTKTWKSKSRAIWSKNKGLILVLISQFFGTVMVVITRLLETNDDGKGAMEPLQVDWPWK